MINACMIILFETRRSNFDPVTNHIAQNAE